MFCDVFQGSFNSEEAENVVKEVKTIYFRYVCVMASGDDYSQTRVNKWTAAILEQLVKLNKPYKYVGTQRTSQSLQHPASLLCFWGKNRNATDESTSWGEIELTKVDDVMGGVFLRLLFLQPP
uniref:Uncharacterized protein n=1 Tax=Xiphophorus maculatus TaxID=8083 RepID=A0A3B5Q7C7_XIPMA